jgi:hypothetical protein
VVTLYKQACKPNISQKHFPICIFCIQFEDELKPTSACVVSKANMQFSGVGVMEVMACLLYIRLSPPASHLIPDNLNEALLRSYS